MNPEIPLTLASRRAFLTRCIAGASLAAAPLFSASVKAAVPPAARRLKKGFMLGGKAFPDTKNITDKFRLLRDAGFHGVEVMSGEDVKAIVAARDATGLDIHSVAISTNWPRPLTDPDPAVRKAGLEGLERGIRDAKAYGAGVVLFVPGVVTKQVSYEQAYERSRAGIEQMVPLAESLGIVIALENVGNRFLLSPIEAAKFVDDFKTKAVRWYFDVGNIMNNGWPEHWIGTLGSRIVRVHVKEYSRAIRDKRGHLAGYQVALLEGDNDWPSVMAAFDAVGYTGWLTTEQFRPPGVADAEWAAQLSGKLDRIIAA